MSASEHPWSVRIQNASHDSHWDLVTFLPNGWIVCEVQGEAKRYYPPQMVYSVEEKVT
jgi:hypothetical protein